MTPSLDQHLQAIIRRLKGTIIPLLPEDAAFAREQAELILVSLQHVREVQPHAYRYAVVENVAARDALAAMLDVAACSRGASAEAEAYRGLLESPGPGRDAALQPMADLEGHTAKLKNHLCTLYAACAENGDGPVTKIMSDFAEGQLDREQALFASTKLVKSERSLAEVLGEAGVATFGADAVTPQD